MQCLRLWLALFFFLPASIQAQTPTTYLADLALVPAR
jgi:hypothetical protein